MDRMKSKLLVAALATAFFGATAYAADNSVTASDPAKGTATDKATSYDTGKTAPFSGAEGVQTTPPASDEDHNDNGGVRGKHHSKPHKSSKASGHHQPAHAAAVVLGRHHRRQLRPGGQRRQPAEVDQRPVSSATPGPRARDAAGFFFCLRPARVHGRHAKLSQWRRIFSVREGE